MIALSISNSAAARAHILEAIAVAGREEILNALVDYNNTVENDIDENGNVWVSNPQSGHWLDDDKLIAFAKFLG